MMIKRKEKTHTNKTTTTTTNKTTTTTTTNKRTRRGRWVKKTPKAPGYWNIVNLVKLAFLGDIFGEKKLFLILRKVNGDRV